MFKNEGRQGVKGRLNNVKKQTIWYYGTSLTSVVMYKVIQFFLQITKSLYQYGQQIWLILKLTRKCMVSNFAKLFLEMVSLWFLLFFLLLCISVRCIIQVFNVDKLYVQCSGKSWGENQNCRQDLLDCHL